MSISLSDGLLVCAIDFGTTYSGYAFSMRSDFQEDPLKIFIPNWNAPSSILISEKTPTTLLLGKNNEFVAFGYEAESKYAELAEEEYHREYSYFRRFKMELYKKVGEGERLTTDTKIKDITEKREMLALDIFAHSLKYFKQQVLDTVRRKGTGVRENEISWVLTVPAIWSDPAKQFMRAAAEKAGIPRHRLMLALEPEAASIYCKYLPLTKLEGGEVGVFKAGSKYLVLDAGGGTIDITVHEVTSDGKLKELEKASGGDWGGTYVDMTFKGFLMDVVGEQYMEAYCLAHTADYIELFRDFEMKKRKKTAVPQAKVTMKIPASFTEWYEDYTNGISIIETTKKSKYNRSMKWEGDKLRITQACFDNFFAKACTGIVDHITDLLEKPHLLGTDIILMVGGFSESPILQQYVRNNFKNCRVVVPRDTGLAVLRGAVLFGQNPRAIVARVTKYSYGVASFEKFDSKHHKSTKKDRDFCTDVFDVHVVKGTTLQIEHASPKRIYRPNRKDQREIDIELYVCEQNKLPKYIDDEGCHYLGKLAVELPNTKGGLNREVTVQLIFGGTELSVRAENEATRITAKFDFLGNEP